MNITIYDVFELNRVLHILMSQQMSYKIQTAFKIHSLIKWLDETESFVFDRLKLLGGNDDIDMSNPMYSVLFSSQISFVGTELTLDDLLNTDGDVKVSVEDIAILEKILVKN